MNHKEKLNCSLKNWFVASNRGGHHHRGHLANSGVEGDSLMTSLTLL